MRRDPRARRGDDGERDEDAAAREHEPACGAARRARRAGDRGHRASLISRPVDDPRIEPADDEVRHQRHDDEDRRDGEDAGLHDRIVALVDPRDDQPPDAGQGEHRLDDDGAAKQHADLDADDGHDRGPALRSAWPKTIRRGLMPLARRKVTKGRPSTEVDGAARRAQDIGRLADRQRQHRQSHVAQIAQRIGREGHVARGRQKRPACAENTSTSMMPSQKSGTLMPKTTKLSVSARDPASTGRCPDAERNADQHGEQHGERRQLKGDRQALRAEVRRAARG